MPETLQPFTVAVPVSAADHMLGSPAAAVTVVEYGDFECPTCAQAYHAVNLLLTHFGASLCFVYRLAFPGHGFATQAAFRMA